MTIVYIHGAKATENSFNYIRMQITGYDEIVLEYDSKDGFAYNLEIMKLLLQNQKDLFFIAHSLGGIYAIHLADFFKIHCLGGVTLSTPYAGSPHALFLQILFPFIHIPFISDITTISKPFVKAGKIQLNIPWLNVVSIGGGIALMGEPNDGVVSISSMKSNKQISTVDVFTDHYEILQSKEAVQHIKLMLLNT